MGILFVIMGLAGGVLIADFAAENHLTTAADQTFKLFGNDWHRSAPVLVVSAAAVGALAVILVAAGLLFLGRRLGHLRAARGAHQDLESRVEWLQVQTAELQAQNVELSGENANLKARLDTLDLDPLRDRLDATDFEAAQERERPETVDEALAPDEAHSATRIS